MDAIADDRVEALSVVRRRWCTPSMGAVLLGA